MIAAHALHAAVGAALLVLAVKTLKKMAHIRGGLKKIEAGHEEMIEGRNEIFGVKAKHEAKGEKK